MAVRPERVPAEEVRQRMLDAGRELAHEVGAALTIEHLRLEEVIQRARVPRSSVYRLWPYREEYIDDLLCYLAGEGSWFSDRTVLDPETFDLAVRVVTDNLAMLASPEGRRALMCEVVRITVTRNYEVLTESLPWRLHMALIATLGSTRGGGARRRIAAALEDAQRRSRGSLVAVLDHLASVLGYRLRDPAFTLHHVQLAGGVLIQAMAQRNVQVQTALAGPDDDPEEDDLAEAARVAALLNDAIPGPGLDGRPARWTLPAFSYLGLVEVFMELDPDFTPPDFTPPGGGPA
jgi:AcrR family transcriptional regulator